MRKMFMSFAATLASVAASGAADARHVNADYSVIPFYEGRVVQLQARINRMAKDDLLTARDADRLRGQAAALRALVGIKARDGLNTAERVEIDLRLSSLSRQVARDAREPH